MSSRKIASFSKDLIQLATNIDCVILDDMLALVTAVKTNDIAKIRKFVESLIRKFLCYPIHHHQRIIFLNKYFRICSEMLDKIYYVNSYISCRCGQIDCNIHVLVYFIRYENFLRSFCAHCRSIRYSCQGHTANVKDILYLFKHFVSILRVFVMFGVDIHYSQPGCSDGILEEMSKFAQKLVKYNNELHFISEYILKNHLIECFNILLTNARKPLNFSKSSLDPEDIDTINLLNLNKYFLQPLTLKQISRSNIRSLVNSPADYNKFHEWLPISMIVYLDPFQRHVKT